MSATTVIVTGAASGVGFETARLLAAQGRGVVGVDLVAPTVGIPGARWVAGSVADAATWEAAIAQVHDIGAPLAGLVVNAARLIVGGLLDVSIEDAKSVFDINVFGAMRAMHTCLPLLMENQESSIVSIASVDGLIAEPGLAAYCSSKGALVQLARSVAVDYGRLGVRSNAICPGAIDTPFFRTHVDAAEDPASFLASKIARHPSGRILDPIDVANVAVFFLSPASRGINGATVAVDGGLTATFDYAPPTADRD